MYQLANQDENQQPRRLTTTNQALTERLQLVNKNKKKKCHGNRREQQRRRRLRKREQREQEQQQVQLMDQDDQSRDEQIQTLPISHNNHQYHESKRKRLDSNQDEARVSQSLSQLSISKETEPNTKKKKQELTSATNMANNHQNEMKEKKKKKKQKTKQPFKRHFSHVSDKVFKKILGNSVPGGHQLVECLNTDEKVRFIRHMMELKDEAQYFDLQRHLWQDYYDLGLKEGQWAPCVSKSFAQQHHLCRTYGHSRRLIEKHLQKIQKELQRTNHELQSSMKTLQEHAKRWQPFFNPNHMVEAIVEYVKKSQRRLSEEFELKRKMLQFDANDHRFIRTFYQCEPSRQQIELAQKIWQATFEELKLKEHEEILRKRIYIQRLPDKMDRTINRSVDQIEQSLSHPVLNNDGRASLISTCSKTVTQFKFDLMTINLETIQMTQRDQQELIVALQNELLETMPNRILQQIITDRRDNMIQRHEIYLKYKLKTFFDEAPMAIDN